MLTCPHCHKEIGNANEHRNCLNESIWSEDSEVKIASYDVLAQINEPWASDILEQIYLEPEELERAKADLPETEEIDSTAPTKDSNGTQLQDGDSVTLIKDLEVKGAGFTAKRGTLVKNITLTNNPKHI